MDHIYYKKYLKYKKKYLKYKNILVRDKHGGANNQIEQEIQGINISDINPDTIKNYYMGLSPDKKVKQKDFIKNLLMVKQRYDSEVEKNPSRADITEHISDIRHMFHSFPPELAERIYEDVIMITINLKFLDGIQISLRFNSKLTHPPVDGSPILPYTMRELLLSSSYFKSQKYKDFVREKQDALKEEIDQYYKSETINKYCFRDEADYKTYIESVYRQLIEDGLMFEYIKLIEHPHRLRMKCKGIDIRLDDTLASNRKSTPIENDTTFYVIPRLGGIPAHQMMYLSYYNMSAGRDPSNINLCDVFMQHIDDNWRAQGLEPYRPSN
jgi:hypothetical protein